MPAFAAHTHQSTRSTMSGWPSALQSSWTPKSPSGLLLICSSSRERFLVNTEQKWGQEAAVRLQVFILWEQKGWNQFLQLALPLKVR